MVLAASDQALNGEREIVTIDEGQELAICCSGGGIRSATFNLGVIQALQTADLFAAVKTISAVSGGSYLAAAHALVTARLAEQTPPPPDPAASAGPAAPPPQVSPAYTLRSPEELHLRDHTRYLLETWQIAVRAIAILVWGVIVNALLVGSVVFIAAKLTGWFLNIGPVGILTGLQTGSPTVRLRWWWWLIPVAGAMATVFLAWLHALPDEQPAARAGRAGRAGRRRSARSVLWGWLRGRGRTQRWLRRLLGEHSALPSNRALVFTVLTAFTLVIAPLAIKGLYTVSLRNYGSWSVITRFLGFSNAAGCAAAARIHPGSHICGAMATSHAAVVANGRSASTWHVMLATFGSVAGAIVALARSALGRLRTYQADLSKSGPLWGKVAAFLRQRLVPWIGSALIVAVIIAVALRWISESASRSVLAGGWLSQLAQCGYAVAAFLLVKTVTDINSTSMHGFYRDRLATAYGVIRSASGNGVADAQWAELSTLRGPAGPALVICAAANCTKSGDLPPGRGCVSFTFTPDDIGLSREPIADGATSADRGDRAATRAYEQMVPFTLFDAVAVSGAAISPVMGKITRPAMRILLAAADVRLGVWLPSPRQVATGTAARGRPGPGRPLDSSASPARGRSLIAGARQRFRRIGSAIIRHWRQPDLQHLWAEAAGTLHLDGRWLYVTDGGHYENLGLVEALRRRPDHLIVVDASGEEPGEFTALGQAISLARSELGVQISIDPSDLKPDPVSHQCKAPYVKGTFTYPEKQAATYPEKQAADHHLFYLKLAVPAGAPWDIIAYQQKHTTFPADSTLQQLYDDQEFEAYRELGYYCAQSALRNIKT
jgi:hypothetical protein